MKNNKGLWLLYAIVVSLVFDGLLRRLAGPSMNETLFFLKDILVMIAALLSLPRTSELDRDRRDLTYFWLGALIVVFPCVIRTFLVDPRLVLFGYKQYALYPCIAIFVHQVLTRGDVNVVIKFLHVLGSLVVITSLVAFLQLRLPSDSILNLAVTGDTMEGFSAGGYLRVSATFPFVAQYAMFLNFALFAVFAAIVFPTKGGGFVNILTKAWLVLPLYLVGVFSTASRGAVLGGSSIVVVAGTLLLVRKQGRIGFRMLLVIAFAWGVLMALREFAPEVVSGYEARSSGESGQSHLDELSERVYYMMTGWYFEQVPTLFGSGLGIMSNGSSRLSQVAAAIRADGTWTENDLANTYFEGGAYLILTWMTFRAWVLISVLKCMLKIQNEHLLLVASLLSGFVVYIGVTGQLGIQPPLAIWFWMSVGLVFTLAHFDRRQANGIRAGVATKATKDRGRRLGTAQQFKRHRLGEQRP